MATLIGTVPSGSKQPLYDDMSNEQWVQGMLLCILEESSVENKDYMLSYFSMLMQDAIELSLGTARKANVPLWVRGSRIGPTCPPACRKRRLIGGDTKLDWILHNKFLFCFLIICIFYTF